MRGWRSYHVVEGVPHGGYGLAWYRPAQSAECYVCRPCPGRRCTCGIYGAYNVTHLDVLGTVVAQVVAHGRVVLHEQGWRAEHVRVERAYADPITRAVVLAHTPAWAEVDWHPDIARRGMKARHSVVMPCSSSDRELLIHAAGASISWRRYSGLRAPELVLRGSHLSHVAFIDCDLRNADFTRSTLLSVSFTDCNLAGATFRDAKARDCTWIASECEGVVWPDAPLVHCGMWTWVDP